MKKRVNIYNFRLGAKLGSGGFAEVYLVTDKRTSNNYAAKKVSNSINLNASKAEIEKLSENEQELIKNLNREIEIMSMISHPAIIAFYGYSPVFFDHGTYPTLVLELASNKSLSELIKLSKSGLAPSDWEAKKFIIIYGVAKGMSFLHEKQIIHRDLKPDNILINESLYPKISDFGLSKVSDPMQNMNSKKCGTPIYMAPELLDSEDFKYDNKIDVYAFAMIMYEIFTLEKPFAKLREYQIMTAVMSRKRPIIPKDGTISDEFIDLIDQCWSQDPDNRPTFSEICQTLESENFQMGTSIGTDMDLILDYTDYLEKEEEDNIISSEDLQDELARSDPRTVQFDLSHDEDDDHRRATLPPSSFKNLQFNKNENHDKPLSDTNYSSEDTSAKESNDTSNKDSTNEENDSTESNLNLKEGKSENGSTEVVDFLSTSEFENLDKSCKKYYEAAEKNDSDALTYVGQSLVKGKNGFPHNINVGVKFLQRAIELNNPESMLIYGEMLLNGNQIPQNKQEGISLLKRVSNDFESSEANLILAEFWLKPEKNEKGEIISLPNYPKAKRYSKEAADNGNVEGMVLYAQICMREHNNEHGKLRRNLKEATKYLKIAINNGSTEAMSVYGELKEECLGIELLDRDEARKFYKKSMKKGNHDGESHYALFKIKTGEEEKEKLGLKLIVDAKEDKNPTAINSYGLVISNGLHDLPANKKEAADCFKEAAAAGNANAMYNYAKCLENGDGVEKNFKEAFKYYKFAFERGEIRAAKNIAEMLFKGDDKNGFPNHMETGNRYLKMLADYGNAAGINLYASNLLDGYGIDKNEKEAEYYLKSGIEKNNSNSLLLYGLLLFATKDDNIKSSSNPSAYIKKAVKLGNEKAKEKCDLFTKGGADAEKNLKEAIKYVRDFYSKE